MINKLQSLITSTFIALTLSSCTNAYKEFYKPTAGLTPEIIAEKRIAPPSSTPIVERINSKDASLAMENLARRGYASIGLSEFNSGEEVSDQSAISFAKELGADLVLLLNPTYTGSNTTSLPITVPTTSTTYTTGSATAYGYGSPVTAYGNSTSTTYGTSTTYIPYTVHRSDYGAAFFVKQKMSLGVGFRELNENERQQIQSNKGIYINLIVDGTPAYNADLLTGDIITLVDGLAVTTPKFFSDYLKNNSGKLISLSIIRNGKVIEKSVQLQN